MTRLRTRATIDSTGRLTLNVPTDLPAGEVDAVVLVEASGHKPQKHDASYDMTDLFGKLQWRGDPVSEQRRLRDEW